MQYLAAVAFPPLDEFGNKSELADYKKKKGYISVAKHSAADVQTMANTSSILVLSV